MLPETGYVCPFFCPSDLDILDLEHHLDKKLFFRLLEKPVQKRNNKNVKSLVQFKSGSLDPLCLLYM